MIAFEMALGALREVAEPNGVLCRTCGARLEECAADAEPAPDRCAGKVVREALAAMADAPSIATDPRMLEFILDGLAMEMERLGPVLTSRDQLLVELVGTAIDEFLHSLVKRP